MKERRLNIFRTAISGLALLAVTAAGWSQELTSKAKEEVLTRMSELVTKNAFVPGKDFSKWPEFLAAHREKIDKAKDAEEFADEIRGALDQFGISHILLMPPKAVSARMNQAIVGIGVSLRPEEEGFRVWNVFEKAPAGEAGIEIGDLIVEVDGKKPTSIQPIAGAAGTQVVIKVKKANGSFKEYTLTRRAFSTKRPETLTWLDKEKKTAVLKVWTFDQGYSAENVEKLFKEAKKAENLVVDLRGNGGGAVMNMVHFLQGVLPKGSQVGTFVTKSLVNRYVEETSGDPKDIFAIAKWAKKLSITSDESMLFKGKIAVLVDGASGSASEISAAALKEVLGAPVVGSKSAGAVLASVMAPLEHGFMLQFPITDYVTVKGVRLEGNGVVPDLEVPPMNKIGEADQAIDKAVLLLKGATIKSLQVPKS